MMLNAKSQTANTFETDVASLSQRVASESLTMADALRVRELLDRCISDPNDNGAGNELMRILRPDVARYSKLPGAATHEFVAWFFSWLFEGGRQFHLLGAVQYCTDDEINSVFSGYLYKIVRSAVADYFKKPLHTKTASSIDKLAFRLISDSRRNDLQGFIQQVVEHLNSLCVTTRVPFRLKYCQVLWPLPDADLQWLHEQAHHLPELIDSLEGEISRNSRSKFPLSSAYIGGLLGVSANVIDVRVRRVRIQLLEQFSKL